MNSYNIYSVRTKKYVTYDNFSKSDNKLGEIFSEDIKILMRQKLSFELGGESLLFLRKSSEKTLRNLLSKRLENKSLIPPLLVERTVLGEKVELNLRDFTDDLLFWLSSIYVLVDDAFEHKYNLKFIFNDGQTVIDNDASL